MPRFYQHNQPFTLESGAILPTLTIAYNTWGKMNELCDNVVWVCHALTANSDVADWWPHTVERNRFLDPEKHFIVCANFLGSHYGTTGPLSINSTDGKPWYGSFPRFTIRDMVHAHQLLAKHLGISRVKLLIGSSVGGFQVLEWCVMESDFAQNAVLIATASRTLPWLAAFNESQRMAIECDPTFGDASPEAGSVGLGVARSIALISYRGENAYNTTQDDLDTDGLDMFTRRVNSYQRHQGKKLQQRFNAYSYYRLTQAFDSHNVGRGRGGEVSALASIKAKCLVVAITSDIIFPIEDHQIMVDNIPDVRFEVIDSDFGHDGFLIEYEKLDKIIQSFLHSN